jgi:hypothetical protein
MSVTLHPGIGGLDPQSLCYSIYRQLYQTFFNAQERKSESNPYGVEEGDDISIRLHNTAYGFAEAISSGVSGEGGGTGSWAGYLPRSGGDMQGPLCADYGFTAGIGNRRLLETYRTSQSDDEGNIIGYAYGIRLTGDVHVGGNQLFVGGMQPLRCEQATGTIYLSGKRVDFADAHLSLTGSILLGESKENGVFLTSDSLLIHGREVYHGGNANLSTVDWSMHDAAVAGSLEVTGAATLSGKLRALQGVELGDGGRLLFSVLGESVSCLSDLTFSAGCGIRISGVTVLKGSGANDVRLEGADGDLLMGGDHTAKIRLMSNLTDIDGEHVLLSPYGAAYFPDSLRVRHNYGGDLLSSYRTDSTDEGIVIHKRLRFGTTGGCYLTGDNDMLAFVSRSDHTQAPGGQYEPVTTLLYHAPSTSRYAPQNRTSNSLRIGTSGDFIVSLNPIEVTGHIGIDGSFTRLTAEGLFFTDDICLRQIKDGIRHSGNAYFDGSLSSERFTSGMAGTGWAIVRSRTTGSISATFDELTVRKRMRLYELEVQRSSATNGALWITDTCSGDSVEKL